MSENLEIMLGILRKYHSIARKSRSETNFLLFSQQLKDAINLFDNIKEETTEEILRNIILKSNITGFYQVMNQDALISYMKIIKDLKNFKFGDKEIE